MKKLLLSAAVMVMVSGAAHATEKSRASLQTDLATYKLATFNAHTNYDRLIDITDSAFNKTTDDFRDISGLSAISDAELGYLDITTLGTLAASKAWTSDASLDTIMPTGGLLTVQSGGAITVNSGATLTVAGTLATTGAVTATGAITSTRAPTADHGTTSFDAKILHTVPVHTTGTNTEYALEITPTIGNSTGGTNTFSGLKIDNVTGDAQVDVTGISIGTGTILGTSNGLTIGSGWDKAAEVTAAATADSGATDMGLDINLTTPIDTTGTQNHYGINIDTTIGNASGGTNVATGINIVSTTGDAQVTETAISIGSGFDTGIAMDSGLKINTTNGTAITAIRVAADTDLDNGETSEVVTVTGATTATRCFGTITNDTTTEVSITSIVTATDQATVQVSGDPGASGADLALFCVN